jgi:tRNA dimethylallyltransferase
MPAHSVPLFIIAGPTAVGKSELAVEVAERCGGEIIGADAFQIYGGLDVLTAKPAPELRARVPHHLVGEIPLTQPFDVAQFSALARERIAQVIARGHIPIVCGGTGLYVRALTHGLADLPGADAALRADLEARTLDDLRSELARLDPAAAAEIDLQNPRRVIRALEVCLLTGRPFSSFREEWRSPPQGVRGVLLVRDRDELRQRIAQRTEAMFATGVEDEVRAVGEVGPTAAQAIGLREIRALRAGEITRAECIDAITLATRRYAKRQLTWFRREPALTVVNLSEATDPASDIVRLAAAR